MNAKSLDDTYFIKNAIACWLHYFPEHKWTPIYKEMMKQDSFNTQPQPDPPPPRAARRRKTTSKDAA